MLVKRESATGSNDLITRYRPCTPDEILGNEAAKNLIKKSLSKNKVNHTILLSGPSGCGKTTAARIIALGLNCSSTDKTTAEPCLECRSCKSILDHNSIDVVEINVGKDSGKGDVAKIVDDLASAPFNSRFKVIIFDEAHMLTTAAKNLLLKEMEDGYRHVYYMFCTNEPEALQSKKSKGGNPFLGRCSKMKFNQLSEDEIEEMLLNISEYEGDAPNPEVIKFIAKETKGVPRDALLILNDVINEESWTIEAVKQFIGILLDEDDPDMKQLCRALMAGKFKEAISVYAELAKKFPVESIRIPVAGYFVACLKNGKNIGEGKIFSAVLDIITVPIYQIGKPGDQVFYNYMFKIIDTIRENRRRAK